MPRQVRVEPEVGHWYSSKECQECFMVIDSDEHDCIEIQYQDGELDEIPYDTWVQMHADEIPEPEDGSAPYQMDHDDVMNLVNGMEETHDSEHIEEHLRRFDLDTDSWD